MSYGIYTFVIYLSKVKPRVETFGEAKNYTSIPMQSPIFLQGQLPVFGTVTLTWQLLFLGTALLGSCFAGCHYSRRFLLDDNMSESFKTHRKTVE